MSGDISIKSKFALVMRRYADLTEEEKVQARRAKRIVSWSLAALIGLFFGCLYVVLFSYYTAGLTRDLLLETCNAFALTVASSFIACWILEFATRLKHASSIPLSVLAGVIFFAGGNQMFDMAMRLKADIATAEVSSVALHEISKLARRDGPHSDVRGEVIKASEIVRSLKDPLKTGTPGTEK